jgi:L-lactate dehydrogenase complex protein LldG
MSQNVRGNRKLLDDVAAAVRDRRGVEAPEHDERIVRLPIDEKLIDRFEREAVEVGMHVERVTSAGLLDHVAELIQGFETGDDASVLLEPALGKQYEALLAAPGVIEDPTEDDVFRAEVGMVSVEAGIAETGSLARRAGPDRPRSFALTPMTLIAVLEASDIVADMLDWIAMLECEPMPAECVLITGPSKTSDIGMKLVTGVHGPGIVHIVVVSDA